MSKAGWKKYLKHTALNLVQRLGILPLFARRHQVPGRAVYVLAYHRVDRPEHFPFLDPAHISTSPEMFDAHMRLLTSRYHPVSMHDVLATVQQGAPLPENAVLVTVDDGYRDFGDILYPIARQYGVQPTLFVPTAYIGQPCFYWWDKLYQAVFWAPGNGLETPIGTLNIETPEYKRTAVKALARYIKAQPLQRANEIVETLYRDSAPPFPPQVCTLTWDELHALSQAGVTIAAHTHTHPILTRVDENRTRKEVRISQKMIARHIGQALPVFAYPDGKLDTFNPSVEDALRAEGIQLAFTMLEEAADLDRHAWLQLPRIGVWSRMTLAQMNWRLTRY
ncbi:MAG: hypothetical protein Fur0018_18850 [Anaerolineales bacterium]